MESWNETGVAHNIPGLCPALVELSLADEEGSDGLREEELFEEVTAVEESCFSRSVLMREYLRHINFKTEV